MPRLSHSPRRLVVPLSLASCLGACAGTGDPPEIAELRVTSSRLSQNESVLILATVTDPDGLDDIAGGKLVTEDGSLFLAPFEQLSNGTFSCALAWSQLHQARPIEFETSEHRTVVARFVDNEKNEAAKPLTLELTCNGLVACRGECVDTASDADHCGSCGHTCPSTDKCDHGTCTSNCEPCLEQHCSLELAVCTSSPECTVLRTCLEGCSDQSCADGCLADHPAGMTSYDDLYRCYVASCPGYCGATP